LDEPSVALKLIYLRLDRWRDGVLWVEDTIISN